MVHQYKLNGYDIVLDTASGSVHLVDDVAYDIIEMYKSRSADEIWFQPNCISHADYYKIIGISRRCGIPIRYFKYAGAESCAVQFANTHR